MLKNYLKMAIRNLKRNKLISFINILGLSLALGCCITVFTFLDFNYLRDSFHKKKDRIYLLTSMVNRDGQLGQWGDVPIPLAPMLEEDYPQVVNSTRIHFKGCSMKYEDKVFLENTAFIDKAFLEMFDFPLKWGNIDNFDSGTEILISESRAIKYFGEENPVGRQVTLRYPDVTLSFMIGGVFEAFSPNASFTVNLAAPFEKFLQADPSVQLDEWRYNIDAAFIELDDPSSLPVIKEGLSKYVEIQNKAEFEWPIESLIPEVLETLSVRSEHIRRDISGGVPSAGNIVMALIGVFMILLASFNYINTAIASGARRLKEIGIRKVVGGTQKQLAFQFISENIILTFLALLLGILWAAAIFIPGFESLVFSGLSLNFDSHRIWVFFILITLFTGILSGAYPAFFISSFRPLTIFSGRQKIGKNRLTKIFLTFQFILSLILISGGLAFVKNANYQAERDWGYNKELVVVVPLVESKDYGTLRNSMSQNPGIISVGGSSGHIGRSTPFSVINIHGVKREVRRLDIGENYGEIMGFRLMQGRMLDPSSADDRANFVMVNTTFLSEMDIEEDPFNFTFQYDSSTFSIAGILEDFHNFNDKTMPLFIRGVHESTYKYLSIKTAPGQANTTYELMESNWKQLFPDIPFMGFYQDEILDNYFSFIQGHGRVLSFVAFLSIILSCMGLFGLVSLNVTFRMKEFSIRKVLGANTMNMVSVMNKQFIILLLIATILGVPLSYYSISLLLSVIYENHMPETPLPSLWATVILYFTSIATISSLIFKVLRNNPAETLRAE